MKERTLRIAKSKVRHFHGRTFCGHLTPSEFLALVEAGIFVNSQDKLNATIWKQKGDSRPSWYYFQLRKVTLHQ